MGQTSSAFMEDEEPLRIINNIQSCIYYKFIHCLFINNNYENRYEDQFHHFCDKYNIQNKDELFSLLAFIKDNDIPYKKFTVNDPMLVGNLLLFIIYYMKTNSLFAYMNRVLYMMMSTNKMRLRIKATSYDEESKDIEMNTDLLIEETIDNQYRLEKMIELNKKIENINKNMSSTYVYRVESNIYHDYDGDVLNFALA
jgi:hypothetical protein